MTDLTSITDTVSRPDEVLDARISAYLAGPYYVGPPVTVAQWRLDNYAVLRRALLITRDYEYVDAMGKISDPDDDPDMIAEGRAQLSAYNIFRKTVKTRFPKE